MRERRRIIYLDNLKLFLIVLVVIYHSAHGYVGFIDWIYKEGSYSIALYNFILIDKSFFMGLFFFISGYFISISIRKTSTKDFVWKRTKRLIFPSLFLIVLEMPMVYYLVDYFICENKTNFYTYYINTYIGDGKVTYGQGWLIVNLFVFSIVYLVHTKIFKDSLSVKIGKMDIKKIIIVLIVLSITSHIIRIYYPINTWINVLFIAIEPAYEFQYIIMFILGISAYRNSWLSVRRKKLCVTSIIVSLIMIGVYYLRLYLPQDIENIIDYWYVVYESILSISISISLIYIFKKYINKTNEFFKALAKDSYIVYIVHIFWVITFQIVFNYINVNIFVKFVFSSLLALIFSFVSADIIRRISEKLIIRIKSLH